MIGIKQYIIETDKLRKNIAQIKNYVKVPVIGVVKGNGYGLGLIPYAFFLKENGVETLAVADYLEALALAENEFSNILLLTPQTDPFILMRLISQNIRLTVGNVENLKIIAALAIQEKAVVHIKIDTGFGRFGFNYKDISEISKAFHFDNVKIEAVYSHFSSSFEKDYKITRQQNERFKAIYNQFKEFGIYAHIANSCAALRFPSTRFDAVRIGSAFLGRLPIIPPIKLHKIGYLKTTVISSSTVNKGENIGYGNRFKAKSTISTAVVEVGYKDGFDIKKAEEPYKLLDVLKYVYNDIKAYHKRLYLYENKNEVLGRVGMYSTTILNKNGLKPNDEIKVSVSPLYVDSQIKREYI